MPGGDAVRSSTILAVVLVLAAPAADAGWRRDRTAKSTLARATIVHDGVERVVGWYAGVAVGAGPAPLVLVLHGGGGSADRVWAGDDGRAWRRLADEHGLVLLVPEGRTDPGDPDGHHWNDCRTGVLEPTAASDADDVGFLRAAVAWAAGRWPVDPARVYVTGASNGGMMSFRMAIDAPDLVAAAAPIIANLPEPHECPDPAHPVPVLIMNGTADPLMPWAGGCVASPRCERGTVLSTEETVAFWVEVNRARSEPVCRDLPDADPHDGSTVRVCTWSGGTGGAEVVLYRVEGGGHSPPGPDPLPAWYRLIAGPKNHDISAPDEIWGFFTRHRLTGAGPRQPAGRVG
jgi:polyhydroxybutyrate depolymerase